MDDDVAPVERAGAKARMTFLSPSDPRRGTLCGDAPGLPLVWIAKPSGRTARDSLASPAGGSRNCQSGYCWPAIERWATRRHLHPDAVLPTAGSAPPVAGACTRRANRPPAVRNFEWRRASHHIEGAVSDVIVVAKATDRRSDLA